MAPSTRAATRRTAAAAVADMDSSSDHGMGRSSQAEELDDELLSSDPDVEEEQLRALDEHRGRPARVSQPRTATARAGSRGTAAIVTHFHLHRGREVHARDELHVAEVAGPE